MKKNLITELAIEDTLKALNKMIDNLVAKKKYNEEAIVKIIFNHLGLNIAYVDGEKVFTQMSNEIKKEMKAYLKERKLEEKEEKAFAIAMTKKNKAKAKTKKS